MTARTKKKKTHLNYAHASSISLYIITRGWFQESHITHISSWWKNSLHVTKGKIPTRVRWENRRKKKNTESVLNNAEGREVKKKRWGLIVLLYLLLLFAQWQWEISLINLARSRSSNETRERHTTLITREVVLFLRCHQCARERIECVRSAFSRIPFPTVFFFFFCYEACVIWMLLSAWVTFCFFLSIIQFYRVSSRLQSLIIYIFFFGIGGYRMGRLPTTNDETIAYFYILTWIKTHCLEKKSHTSKIRTLGSDRFNSNFVRFSLKSNRNILYEKKKFK